MPNHTSLYANTGFVHLLSSAPRTADANSTGLDLQDCDDEARKAEMIQASAAGHA